MTVETNGTFPAYGTAGPQRYFWNTPDITASPQRENSKNPDGELVSNCCAAEMVEDGDRFRCESCGNSCSGAEMGVDLPH